MADNKSAKRSFTREELVKSRRFADKRDVVAAVLEKDKSYTVEETERKVSAFLKRKGMRS